MPVQILNDTPLALAFTAGRLQRTGFHLTAIVKGAFKLIPGHVAEVDERPLLSGDRHWNDELTNSLRYASDFAPLKPRADVLVTGTCHQPGGRAEGTARVAIRVGPVKKALLVSGDRHFIEQKLGGHTISDPVPFRSMPLRWERSYGGPGFAANPVGKGWAAAHGPRSRPLPNIELASRPMRAPGDLPEPGGLGPVDARWLQRATHLGTYGERWVTERWPDFPEDFDHRHFNAAPEDQQAPALRGDEPISIEGMHPELARLDAHLPGLRPRCFLRKLQKGEAPPEEVELKLDTVVVDMDALTLVLVWRGVSPVWSREYAEVEKALLVVESLADPPLDAAAYQGPERWDPAHASQEQLAIAEETAARAGDAPPPAPPPPPEVDHEAAGEKAGLDEMRADLEKAGADPALMDRLKGVTRADVFSAILQEEAEKEAAKEKKQAEPEGKDASEPLQPAAARRAELDAMLEDVKKAGADPALIARLAAATTAPRFLEILLAEMPPGDTAAEKKERSDLVDSIRKIDAETEAAELAAEGERRQKRGDRLTRPEVGAIVAAGGSLAEANLTELDLSRMTLKGVNLTAARLDGARLGGTDLTGADLTGASLRLSDLSRATLVDAIAQGADLEGAILRGADMTRSQLARANLSSAQLEGATLDDADLAAARMGLAALQKASMKGAILDGADMARANLQGASASKAKLRGADLQGADLSGADLAGAVLFGAVLDGAQLAGASLKTAHLDGARGEGTSFQGADLTDARAGGSRFHRGRFERAVGRGSTWLGADLTGSSFESAEMSGAILSTADLSGCSFDLAKLKEADLSRAKLLGARITRADLFRARLGGADLTDADCRASNLFECDLFEANATRARFERSNLKRTILAPRSVS